MRLLPALAVCLLPPAGCLAAPPDTVPAHIRIPVWVEPGGGAAGFRATLSGSASRILATKCPADDLLLMLVLDLTQDLTQATLAKDALVAEIHKLPPKTAVAVLRAQDTLKVLANPAPDRARVAEAIQGLPISGKAGLLDAVEFLGRAGDAILKKTAVRVAILCVTDSDIGNYRENFANPVVNSSDTRDLSRKFPEALVQERISKLSTRLSRQQTPLFIVHLIYRTDRLNQAYQSGLTELAETTAGASLFCHSNAEVAAAIHHSLGMITSHYSLTLALPPRAPKSVHVQITADPPSGQKVVTHRTRLVVRGN